MSFNNLDQRGAALISVLITLPFLLLIAFNFTQLSVNNLRLAQNDQYRTQTQMVADASIDYGLQQLNEDLAWAGTGGEIINGEVEQTYEVEFDNVNNVRTTYALKVTNIDDDNKTMTTTARLYRPASSTTPLSSITIDAELRPVTAGDFSIVTGVGGLNMENSAKVLGGSIFVNGTVRMKNTAQIGLQLSPVELKVAHQVCPLPTDPNYSSEYPRVCTLGENGQPITFENSSRIYGDVYANNQTSSENIVGNLVASSGVTPQALPAHNREAQKTAATNIMTSSDASCTQNNGTKTWPANTKITGNVLIEKSCKVTMQGDVWITGTLDMQNSGQIRVSNDLGTTQPTLMVDGNRVKLINTSQIVDNTSGTGIRLISYYSTAACSPDCANVTGNDFKTSREYVGIELDNLASGPSTVFYARWTTVQISNSGQIGALIGQTVNLRNSGTITFGTSVGTGTEFWVLDGYRRVFN